MMDMFLVNPILKVITRNSEDVLLWLWSFAQVVSVCVWGEGHCEMKLKIAES